MSRAKKKMTIINANISGEMKPEDIIPADGVNVDAIKAGDEDPLEVVVEVPAGKSTRGWNYKPESLKAIVSHVNQHTLSGFLGHQKPEEVATKFEAPVTHWVGAKMEGAKAYFRGVVDKSAPDLKRWIRSGRIKQVSIFGFPKLATAAGETDVIDYKPLSIDWTPLDRAGMPTKIVAMGEMDEFEDEGGKEMDWKELVAQLKTQMEEGIVKLQEIISAIDPEEAKKTTDLLNTLEKIRELLGVEEDGDLIAAVEEAQKAKTTADKAVKDNLVKEVVQEKVNGEMAQNIISKMIVCPEGATKEIIAGEIDGLLADPSVKEIISRLHTDKPVITGAGSGIITSTSKKTKRVSL